MTDQNEPKQNPPAAPAGNAASNSARARKRSASGAISAKRPAKFRLRRRRPGGPGAADAARVAAEAEVPAVVVADRVVPVVVVAAVRWRAAEVRPAQARQAQLRPQEKVCRFCVDRVDYIDYKKAEILAPFIQERGKILPRRMTGTCARHQRWLTVAIKRAQNIALFPFAAEL